MVCQQKIRLFFRKSAKEKRLQFRDDFYSGSGYNKSIPPAAQAAGAPIRMTGGFVLKKLNQWIDRFAYSHPRFGIPNLMLYIVIANAVTYALTVFAGSSALTFWNLTSTTCFTAGMAAGDLLCCPFPTGRCRCLSCCPFTILWAARWSGNGERLSLPCIISAA